MSKFVPQALIRDNDSVDPGRNRFNLVEEELYDIPLCFRNIDGFTFHKVDERLENRGALRDHHAERRQMTPKHIGKYGLM